MVCSGDEVVELNCVRVGGGGGDPGEYAAVLKRKLQLYCAAVAKTMEAKPQESSLSCLNSQASDTSQLVSQVSFDGDGTVVQGKPANSCTSKEQSDDDDGDLEENTDPASAKRVKRMLSNRESARRSRKRKQAHQNDIESQVTQLRAENASLLKRLTDMTQKYKEASLGNRNLTVDIETMRRKVNIAEEAVRRVTGTSLLFSTTSDMPRNNVPFASCVSGAASADAAPTEESMSHFLQGLLEDDLIKHDLPDVATPLPSGDEMASRPVSLRRVASLENLQKRIHRDPVHSEDTSIFLDHEVPANAQ